MPASYRYPNIIFDPKPVPTEQPTPTQRFVRTNFIGAGLDNFAQPPSQDPQMFEVLNNVMPIVNGTLQKRWGYTFWNNPSANPAQFLYDYLNDVNGSRAVILSSATYVEAFNDDGSVFNPSLFTPAPGSNGPRAAISRGYEFFSDGLSPDYLKWDGSAAGGVTNWGININNTAGAFSGPNGPGTATDTGSSGIGGSIGPSDIGALAQTGASPYSWTIGTGTADVLIGDDVSPTPFLNATSYAFAVPGTATIIGITLTISHESFDGDTFTGSVSDNSVNLLKAGTQVGTNKASPTVWTDNGGPETFTYGSPTDLWGTTWTASDINDPNFGAQISIFGFGGFIGGDPNFNRADVYSMRLTVYFNAISSPSWTNPNNILANDGAVATALATVSSTSQLNATNFGFAVATNAVIQGIQVDVKCSVTSGAVALNVGLIKDSTGAEYGATRTQSISSTSLGFITFGGPTDLWSGTWLPADLNSANFGAGLIGTTMSGGFTINIDFVRVTVYAATGPLTVGAPTGVGNVTLIQGRVYFVVFENSSAVNYSDLNVPSLSSGPATNQTIPLSNIPVSLDPQVDRTIILATADGGDETTLYLLADLPAGTTTYTDNTSELTLLASPILLSTDSSGNEFGVPGNNPPPVGALFPTIHRGNMVLVKGPQLYWSKSLTEVTTADGFIAGRWEEDWPASNQLNVGQGAEDIRGLLSDGINLYVGTEYKIRRVIGALPSLEDPDIVHNEAGIMNQDVWKITFVQGTPVGAMWLTPDKRVIGSDFNTYTDVGTSIQTTLNSLNVNAAPTVAHASFYSNAAFDLYILGIPTGINTFIDTFCVYNLRTQTWVTWTFVDIFTNLFFHIQANGVPQLLLAATTGKNYFLDPTVLLDRNGDITGALLTYVELASDNFQRPNETPLNPANWVETVATAAAFPPLSVFNNVCVAQAGDGYDGEIWNATPFPSDQYVEVTLGTIAGFIQPTIRTALDGTCYYVSISGFAPFPTTTVFFYNGQSGDTTTLLEIPSDPLGAPGDVYRLSVVGSRLSVFKNGSIIGSVLDTTLITGQPGLFLTWASVFTDTSVSKFAAGAVSNALASTTTIKTSWLDLNDASLQKCLNEIEVQTGDTNLLVTVEGSSTIQDFASPNSVCLLRPLKPGPRGTLKVFLASSKSKDRYYRFTFLSINAVNIILGGYNIESVPFSRL